jgi:hypothetical protein
MGVFHFLYFSNLAARDESWRPSMEQCTSLSDTTATTLSRRSILKGSITLTAAAMAAPVLMIGAVESAAPLVERAATQIAEWYEEVGGI